ncbi:hypothetical protein B0I35DRAFT_365907 [Stachybotrys elegans]|uniref:BTB domain-containing protein n=1 Tax=Stachybotrys elegans TaxID=80388 RepID=A0A8K0S9X7_9HYPO|nr:hypothetical protein B0I35DRAFT_365907 [Stachybotrys elegans]
MNHLHGDNIDSFEDVTSDGNLVLIVGEQKKQLRVQSQCLSCASKVFRVMFSPPWSDDRNLSADNAKEISLLEDDAQALYIIFCVLHHRNDILPQELSPQQVLQVAIAADKYDVSVALQYVRAQWLKHGQNDNSMDMAYLLAAAFLFDDAVAFEEIAMALILQHRESYVLLLEDSLLAQILTPKITDSLNDGRNRMRAEIGTLLIHEKFHACSCDWGKARSATYEPLLLHYSPLHMLECSVSEAIEEITKVSQEGPGREYHPSFYGGGYAHEPSKHIAAIAEKIKLAKRRASICIDCIQERSLEGSCRFKHK